MKKKPFIIAEVGNNHEGNFTTAKKLIKSAKKTGVDAVKIQIIKPENFFEPSNTLAIKKYSKFLLKDREYLALYKFAKKNKIILFSTFFDFDTAKRFAKYQPVFKIASCDNNNINFIEYFLKFNKPIFISLGLLDLSGTEKLYKELSSHKNKRYLKNITFLHCVSQYPTPENEINLNTIKFLKKKFPKIQIGFSDHTIGPNAACYASILGAEVIEKHFTLKKNFSSFRDHSLSADFNEMSKIVKFIKNSKCYLGKEIKLITKDEKINHNTFRRYPFFKKNMKKSSIIKISDINFLRISPKNFSYKINNFVGKKLIKNVKINEMLKKSQFEK